MSENTTSTEKAQMADIDAPFYTADGERSGDVVVPTAPLGGRHRGNPHPRREWRPRQR